jgi:hypothetical protein
MVTLVRGVRVEGTELMLSNADALPGGSAGVSVTAARERERRSNGSPEDAVESG